MRWIQGRVIVLAPAIAIFAIFSQPLHGAELTSQYKQCIDRTETNTGWSDCSRDEIKRQESLLATAWKRANAAIKTMSPEAAKSLLEEQRAWIKFKESSCGYYASGAFGREGQALGYGACEASIIADRVKALNDLADDIKD